MGISWLSNPGFVDRHGGRPTPRFGVAKPGGGGLQDVRCTCRVARNNLDSRIPFPVRDAANAAGGPGTSCFTMRTSPALPAAWGWTRTGSFSATRSWHPTGASSHSRKIRMAPASSSTGPGARSTRSGRPSAAPFPSRRHLTANAPACGWRWRPSNPGPLEDCRFPGPEILIVHTASRCGPGMCRSVREEKLIHGRDRNR